MQTNNKYDIKFICEDSEREENATTVVGAVEFSFSFATLIKVKKINHRIRFFTCLQGFGKPDEVRSRLHRSELLGR